MFGARGSRCTAGMLAFALLCASRVRAYEERVTLELATAYALVPQALPEGHGVSLGLATSIGLGQRWALDLSAGYLGLFGTGAHHFVLGRIEAGYMIDVVQIVPRLSFGAAGIVSGSGGEVGDLGPTLRVGFDRLRDAGFWGMDLRVTVFPAAHASSEHVLLELGFRFGFLIDRF